MQYIEMENEMARYFHTYQQSQIKQGRYSGDMELSMWLSPAYWLAKDGAMGGMSCDTYTYHIYYDKQKEDYFCELLQKRAEAVFLEQDGYAAITDFEWYTIQAMKPWPYGGRNPFQVLAPGCSLPKRSRKGGEEYLKLRNLQNLFFERRLHQIEGLFSERPDTMLAIECLELEKTVGRKEIGDACRHLLEQEQGNRHGYCFLGITGSPVIEFAEDGQQAQAVCTIEVFQADMQSACIEYWKLKRQMGWVRTSFCREGEWKIYQMEIRIIAELPQVPYRNDGRYDKMGHTMEEWEMDQPMDGQSDPEVCMEIENIMNGWVYASRRGELSEYVNNYMKNPQGMNHMHMKSFGKDSKVLNSYEEILEKVTEMTSHYQERNYTYHAPTTPVITLNEAGDRARGTWFDHASTNLGSREKSTQQIPYMVFVNKYVHDFSKIDGKWYFTGFVCEPLIGLPDWELDAVHSRGYVTASPNGKFPKRFELGEEEYYAEDDR